MKNEARTIALRTISIFKIHLVNEKLNNKNETITLIDRFKFHLVNEKQLIVVQFINHKAI